MHEELTRERMVRLLVSLINSVERQINNVEIDYGAGIRADTRREFLKGELIGYQTVLNLIQSNESNPIVARLATHLGRE